MMKSIFYLLFLISFLSILPFAVIAQEFKQDRKTGKYYLKDIYNTKHQDILYDSVSTFKYGISITKTGNHYGAVNTSGRIVLPSEYDEIRINSASSLPIRKGDLFGLANGKGELLLPVQFEKIDHLSLEGALVKTGGQWKIFKEGSYSIPAKDVIFHYPDQPAQLSECVDVETKDCSRMQLIRPVFKQLNYPPIARENGITGTVTIGVLIDAQGVVNDIHLINGIGYGCDEAALNAIRLGTRGKKWEPAKQDGEAVSSYYLFPVGFNLH